ncbi:UNVERIFIED_CONTAM: hypothetical protein H355_008575 [Colinus virginianus]|nr:hypothetical protein H355_008575 [Colinus virginianus]
MSCDVGVYGLAVMGLGLSLKMAERGFKVCVCNRTPSKVDHAVKRAKDEKLSHNYVGVKSIEEMVTNLSKPRRIMIVIEAGKPVETLISHFLPMLDKGDCLVDAGNEFHETTQKREQWLASKGVLYMDVGLCTGQGGARSGPPLTPGGSTEAWKLMEPILVHISGKIDPYNHVPALGSFSFTVEERQNACVTHLGPAGAGHYVKMVHNGIAYGDMQLIAEAYHFLRYAYGQTNEEIGQIFEQWNEGELRSYLLGITKNIVKKKDVYTGGHLIDFVVDAAGARGTGKWTVQEAADLGIAVPTIAAALDLRYISSNVSLREKMNQDLRRALVCGRICCHAQGLQLLHAVSKERGWDLRLGEITRIWQAGCLIESDLLRLMRKAYINDTSLENILLDKQLSWLITQYLPSLQRIIMLSLTPGQMRNGTPLLLPAPAHAASYYYLLCSSSVRLSVNIVQAQRDCFGAHHFKRTDREGKYHETNWGSEDRVA